ncbi:MAG: hypothetical protein WBM99_10190 [Psychromonas sp.]
MSNDLKSNVKNSSLTTSRSYLSIISIGIIINKSRNWAKFSRQSVKSSLKLLRDSLHGLSGGVPEGISLVELADKLAKTPDILFIADLHVWTISAERTAFSVHVYLLSLNH